MTDQPQHSVDPNTIPVGAEVTFVCPKCPFTFRHFWLPSDGTKFGDSHCFMHDPAEVMVITSVVVASPPQ